MTITAAGFSDETTERARALSRKSYYPVYLLSSPPNATAGTGIIGEPPDLPSPSMTQTSLQQAGVFCVLSGTELESAPKIVAKILRPNQEEQTEPDVTVWRGVFAPSYRRRVLFSAPMELQTANLPRRKPRIIIDRRTLERAEDE